MVLGYQKMKISENQKVPKKDPMFTKTLKLIKASQNTKNPNYNCLYLTSFLMEPLTTLYDKYIDRPKTTEQNKV